MRRGLAVVAAACLLGGVAAGGAEPSGPGASGSGPPHAPRGEGESQAQADLPGASLEGLSAAQRALVASWAKDAFCYCGCPHTVAQCLREHRSCRHAARMVGLAARLVRAGANQAELAKTIESYYASFDKRVRLEVADFGPPLGGPAAKVTLVEFSDFTCPYCQLVRPALEAFVRARPDRVRFFFKPFPIESHPGALEAAQAGEWAREKGRFWEMHDALFGNPSARSVADLADLARSVGLEAAELRAALGEKRLVPKIRASQAEARAAGLRGTPTLFLEGRLLVLPDYAEEGLELTLEDEEEWQAHEGWTRD